MRYLLAENTWIIAKFDTGDTVTVILTDLSDNSTVTLTSGSATEIGSTGIFKWNTSNIQTQPTVLTEYLYTISNGTSSQYGKLVVGGYPNTLVANTGEDSEVVKTTQENDTKTTDIKKMVSLLDQWRRSSVARTPQKIIKP